MKNHQTIDDKALSEKFNRPIEDIKEKMEVLSNKNKRKDWIVSSLNNRYIFYNEGVVQRVKKLYNQGINEKHIFEKLKKDIPIKTRAEIKAIEDILIKQGKIKKRARKFSKDMNINHPRNIR